MIDCHYVVSKTDVCYFCSLWCAVDVVTVTFCNIQLSTVQVINASATSTDRLPQWTDFWQLSVRFSYLGPAIFPIF